MTWTLNGTPVVHGQLQHPAEGTWHATLQTTDDLAPGGPVTLSLPGLDLQGTVVEAGVFAERCTVRVVGGVGKMAESIPGQDFTGATGMLVAQSILSAAGEMFDEQSDAPGLQSILQKYSYFAGPASVALDRLCSALACSWWVTPQGMIHLGVLVFPPASPTGALTLDVREDLRRLTVALEDEALVPRTTYEGKQVLEVDHTLTDTAWRAHARYQLLPLDRQLQALVQRLQLRTIPPLDAQVLSQDADGSLELQLQLADDLRELWGVDAGFKGVPLALQGCWTVQIAPGARVVLEFLDGDPQKPIVRSIISGQILKADLGQVGTLITMAGSSQPVVRVGDVLAMGLVSPSGAVTGTIAIAPPISTVKA